MKNNKELKHLLEQVASGTVSPEEAAIELREIKIFGSHFDLFYFQRPMT